MNTEKGYNGWTNYETWNIKLWIDNDQGTQEYWHEQAQYSYKRAKSDKTFSRLENAALTLKDVLKDDFEEHNPLNEHGTAGPYHDLLNAALSEVNWYEIAQSLLEDAEVITEVTQ